MQEAAGMLDAARALCRKAHEGQLDKGGQPYWQHPFAVADAVEGDSEKATAYLHDVVEDTSYSLDDLRDAGFPECVVRAVDALTHREGEPYRAYLDRVRGNKVALAVKLADAAHNGDPTRPATTPARVRKYQSIRRYLLGEVDGLEL